MLTGTLSRASRFLRYGVAGNTGFAKGRRVSGPKMAGCDVFAKRVGHERRFCKETGRSESLRLCKTVVRGHDSLQTRRSMPKSPLIFDRLLQNRQSLPFIVDYQKIET